MSEEQQPTEGAAAVGAAAEEATAAEASDAEATASGAAASAAAGAESAVETAAASAATPEVEAAATAPAEAAPAAAAPEPERETRRGPSGYVESEGGRTSRIGSGVKVSDVDYKNIALLSRFLDRRGRILSRRKTRVSAKVQRRVAVAIKRARHLALLPYTADQTRTVRKRR